MHSVEVTTDEREKLLAELDNLDQRKRTLQRLRQGKVDQGQPTGLFNRMISATHKGRNRAATKLKELNEPEERKPDN